MYIHTYGIRREKNMSQKDTTKSKCNTPKPNPNNHYHYSNNNDTNNQNTMKYENKRSMAAAAASVVVDGGSAVTLYENFIPQDNNNKYPNLAVERQPQKSAPFIDVQQFVHNTTGPFTFADEEQNTAAAQLYVKDNKLVPDYENVNFKRHLELDKKILLQKYFRTALVGPRDNIYENLCRGCNYGVFTARGPLCSFCECIVNGVHSINASPAESSNNIYENICENCAQFYSGNEEDCQCRKKKELVVTFREALEEEESKVVENKEVQEKSKKSSLKKVGSEDCLLTETKEQKVKIRKSQSFSKSVKPKKLTNFWETLRRNKTSTTPVRKPLEIVHNVEGYDQVFHTKESFDLQRICELKRSATSCSDQHIYGRLKPRYLDLVRSQEDFLSTQSLTQNEPGVRKKKRISKAKFLRSISINSTVTNGPELPPKSKSSESTLSLSSTQALQAVYLNNSICQWMTSLRYDFVNLQSVNTCILNLSDEEECDCLCYPKSIPPAKRLLFTPTSCKTAPTPPLLTNRENIPQTPSTTKLSSPPFSNTSLSLLSRDNREDTLTDTDSLDSAEIVTLRRHLTNGDSLGVSREEQIDSSEQPEEQEIYCFLLKDHYQQMVDEFKFHLVNKQVKQKQQQRRLENNENMVNNNKKMASAGVTNNNSSSSNHNNSGNTMSKSNVDIPLRQAASNHNKAKRQGMYLRLEEQHNLQNPNTENNYNVNSDLLVLPKREKLLLNTQDDHTSINNEERLTNSNRVNPTETELSTVKSKDSNAANAQESLNQNDDEYLSRTLSKQQVNSSQSITAKRSGIHESNILQAFENLLRQEQQQQQSKQSNEVEETANEESQTKDNNRLVLVHPQQSTEKGLQPFVFTGVKDQQHQTLTAIVPTNYWTTPPVFDLLDLINGLQLSCSLNTAVIHYDLKEKQLFVFLRYISRNGEKYKHATHGQLVRKYQRFLNYLCSKTTTTATTTTARTLFSTSAITSTSTTLRHCCDSSETLNSVDLKLDLMKTNGNLYGRIRVVGNSDLINNNDSCDPHKVTTTNANPSVTPKKDLTITEINNNNNNNNKRTRKPPEVPKRDPKTKLSPSTEQLPPIPAQRPNSNMTVPSSNLIKETQRGGKPSKPEESIYQPIWKCKTVGEVQERFKTDEDYYTIEDLKAQQIIKLNEKSSSGDVCMGDVPEICITEEDHSEWEPDEEFVFTTQLGSSSSCTVSVQRSESLSSSHDRNGTIRSNRSHDSSIGSTSLSGSTITDFASSTATLASCVSSSLVHHLLRNIGIFYSLTEPKLKAIIYDYDRIHSSRYFAKPIAPSMVNDDSINDSGLGKSPTPSAVSQNHHHHHSRQQQQQQQRSQRSPVPVQRLKNGENCSPKCCSSESVTTSAVDTPQQSMAKVVGALAITSLNPVAAVASIDGTCSGPVVVRAEPSPSFPAPNASVLAWKQQLLNVNYMEDEEDMIVSESEIIRSQTIKEDVQPQQFIQRFKSRSTDNILDLPIEDDKKTIAERMRSRLQRGILNINSKSSPKSEKKLYKSRRNSQTTSLYLEDGLKPKNPIFGAPLDQLELNRTTCPNVPRFVADSIEYIERKDRIVQDGLYRACGNKFTIDELKQKLTKSYIYDPKLIVADDIHTVTSLLKQFFRDLPHPLIPQETYNCLARDLLKIQDGIDTFRIVINDMPEPNKSTLAFLIKHLTNVAACSASNRMNASNLAIVWGPSLFTLNEAKTYDIGRMNTLAKVLIENYDRIFHTNERLL